ncbi:hypothetical protein PLICRDRAFT_47258 [Plicaturopsis crispa FD-325 SS-3]|uniref:DUF6697 domain-containing protein n=1 Tax=Plicaturopsis crispa FD-325 SS-3 TaxID=944288 RepID=A0A0C9SQ58_PLICR|nr:hypothetical protein PLICRDRAFT_47258 [Plicaturopsis crispa FD-325 SS-3]
MPSQREVKQEVKEESMPSSSMTVIKEVGSPRGEEKPLNLREAENRDPEDVDMSDETSEMPAALFVERRVSNGPQPPLVDLTNDAPRTRRTRRLVLDAVVIENPNLWNRKRSAQDDAMTGPITDEDANKLAMQKMRNPKVKTKENIPLHDSISQRLIDKGLTARYPIDFPEVMQGTTFSRDFLHDVVGANTRRTFPKVAQKHVDRHGFSNLNLMCINLYFDPRAPQTTGAPALFFNPFDRRDRGDEWPVTQTVISRIERNHWQVMGQYKLSRAKSLTAIEWRSQPPSVKLTWATEIRSRVWGKRIRARMVLRKEIRREPTKQEVDIALDNRRDLFKNQVSVEEVMAAYNDGDEFLAVWYMECIGYDREFQTYLVNALKTWVQKAKPRREKAGEANRGVKRTHPPSQDGSDSDSSQDEGDGVRRGRAKDLVYIPKGTRSRPLVIRD